MKKNMFIVMFMVLCLLPGYKIRAAEYKEVSGTFNYDYAFEVLKLVNIERGKEGISPLSMDKSLLDSAMARAAEITVVFDHVRPNGQMCFSINDKIYGENIAFGQSYPEAVMESWMNSDGHRANIMNSSYKSIGVGCMTYEGGLYWVQVFGFDEAENVTCPQNINVTCKVSLDSKEETIVGSSEDEDSCDEKPEKVEGVKTDSNKKKITVKWKNSQDVDGYELQISQNKRYKTPEKYYFFRNANKVDISILSGKRLKLHKKYYVRIRSFKLNDQGIEYSKWKKKTVRVK